MTIALLVFVGAIVLVPLWCVACVVILLLLAPNARVETGGDTKV